MDTTVHIFDSLQANQKLSTNVAKTKAEREKTGKEKLVIGGLVLVVKLPIKKYKLVKLWGRYNLVCINTSFLKICIPINIKNATL